MLTAIKKRPNEKELFKWLASISGFIQNATKTDNKPTRLYDYQLHDISNTSSLQIINKARQIGISYGDALAELARCHLEQKPTTAIFVSFNFDEAKEKIRYAKMAYESMPLAWKKGLVTDSKTELEFAGGNRLLSHPQTPVRGKSAIVYFDEFAHWRDQRIIYTSALPSITRGDLFLKIRSTPFGQNNLFHEIWDDQKKYPAYTRVFIPWWHCPDFCKNVKEAKERASRYQIQDRLSEYGTDKIKMIFENMYLEDFLQEYEGNFVDETTSYYPYELILPCTKDEDELTVYTDLETLAKNKRGQLYAGFDVGRRNNTSELFIVEKQGERCYHRFSRTFDKESFEAQKTELHRAMDLLNNLRIAIDETGIGMQLAEEMKKRYSVRVEQISFTSTIKEQMAVTVHRYLEERNVWIKKDRELIGQIHSVKRILLPGGKHRYDTEKNEKHHADKFWAMALALSMATTPSIRPVAGLSMKTSVDTGQKKPMVYETF